MSAAKPAPGEDRRVVHARQVLADARAAVADESEPYEPEIWAARLEVAVEGLLELVGEREEHRS